MLMDSIYTAYVFLDSFRYKSDTMRLVALIDLQNQCLARQRLSNQ